MILIMIMIMMSDEELQKKHQRQIMGAFANYQQDVEASTPKLYEDLPQDQPFFKINQQRKRAMLQHALQANQLFLNHILASIQEFPEQQAEHQEKHQQKRQQKRQQESQQAHHGNQHSTCQGHQHLIGQKHSHEQQREHQREQQHQRGQQRGQQHEHAHSDKQFRPLLPLRQLETNPQNCSKIRTTLKQFYREWCGQSVQRKDYIRIAEKCAKYLKPKDSILVPGCGLGRLLLELIICGFAVQGNEVTYFMLFGSNFILNSSERKEQYTIYPFIHNAGYHFHEEDPYRPISIPDILATEVTDENSELSIVAGEFTEVYSRENERFEGVATCFFLDTANNVFDYIDVIWSCLKPGGIWVNFGPLLYHYRSLYKEVSVEVSWGVLREYIGDRFEWLQEDMVETTYCHDPLSKLTVKYRCIEFVVRKK